MTHALKNIIGIMTAQAEFWNPPSPHQVAPSEDDLRTTV